jgi:hypothetical protein
MGRLEIKKSTEEHITIILNDPGLMENAGGFGKSTWKRLKILKIL